MIRQRPLFSLSNEFETQIEKELVSYSLKLTDAKRLAEAVKKLSDYFIKNPQGETPWRETWAQIAYTSYFAPLNYLRNKAVVTEGIERQFFQGLDSLYDFGAGLGSATWALSDEIRFKEIHLIEKSEVCRKLHRSFLQGCLQDSGFESHESMKDLNIGKNALAAMSYSLTELKTLPAWALQFEAVMILEPSTREDGRALGQTRQFLIDRNYEMMAPCPHQGPCPLITKSENDWCHDRIHVELPEWMREVESHLPFRNQTLTCSYLLARKKGAKVQRLPINLGRLVGDALVENGKTRQLLCRGSEREFLVWMHRHFPKAEGLERGLLLDLNEMSFEQKSQELRLQRNSSNPGKF